MNSQATTTGETLRQELKETRLAYHALLAAIPDSAWDNPTPNPAWNVRQMMFHITLALRFLPGDIALLRRGHSLKVPPWLFNRVNEWYTGWAGNRQTRSSLAAEYDRHHESALALLDTIEPDEWMLAGEYPDINQNLQGTQTIADMFHYLTVHFEEHAADVRQSLEHGQSATPRQPPTGLDRWLYRAPIYLYRAGLGWLLGQRFLLLHHTGRKSGLPRQAVLEVVEHDGATDTYFVASGFGRSSHWFQNVQANPDVVIQVGVRKLAVTADILSREASGEMMVRYARRHPLAARSLSRVLGIDVDGTEAGYRRAGREQLPFVAFRRRSVLRNSPRAKQLVAPLLLLLGMMAGLVAFLRRRTQQTR